LLVILIPAQYLFANFFSNTFQAGKKLIKVTRALVDAEDE